MEAIILAFFLIPIYFLPSLIAFKRDIVGKPAMLIINIFIGWKITLWPILLIWALTGHRSTTVLVVKS